MEKKNIFMICLALLLAAGLVAGMPLKARACGGGGGMDHSGMDHGSYGHMSQGYGGQGYSGHMGLGQMGPGMMSGSEAPAGTRSQPEAPGSSGSGHMGGAGSMDHSQMGHGPSGTTR